MTEKILSIFKGRLSNAYPPYDPATRKALDDMKAKLFDRVESRAAWEKLTDKMFDGKLKDGKPADRTYFQTVKKEYWEEQPYMYEEAYSFLSEAIMYELSLNKEEMAERVKLRDSDKGEEAEKF